MAMTEKRLRDALKASDEQPHSTVLVMYTDAGHGWLGVPTALVRTLGIHSQISRYSYVREGTAYLEEDCDANLAIKAMQAQGIPFTIREVHSDFDSPIRYYSRYSA